MPQPDARIEIYRFGAFELASATGELRKNGLRLKLQDQPTRILILLLENAGEIVTREQIQKRRWADDAYVDYENAINSAVRKLREVLIDTSDNPRFVETLPKRGYRFIAPVSRVEPEAPVGEVKPAESADTASKTAVFRHNSRRHRRYCRSRVVGLAQKRPRTAQGSATDLVSGVSGIPEFFPGWEPGSVFLERRQGRQPRYLRQTDRVGQTSSAYYYQSRIRRATGMVARWPFHRIRAF